MLSPREITRYSRNILLSEVGKKGQEKLSASKITVIGAGGLGSPTLFYLAATGVGEIRIVDSDKVDLTNLQRQILFKESSIGKFKSEEAVKILSELNPNLKLISIPERISEKNYEEILFGSDLVIEGSDNFETKFLVNDACYFLNIPLLIGGIFQFEGQIIGSQNKYHCYRCIFDKIPSESIPNCSEAGVIGSVAGIIGSILATESIKFLLSKDDSIFKNIFTMNSINLDFRKIPFQKNPNCCLCGNNPSLKKVNEIQIQLCEV